MGTCSTYQSKNTCADTIPLIQFQKPSRYIGQELYSVNYSQQKISSIVLAYPDLYEIGMSNLGLKILYNILNRIPEVIAERVFLPYIDLIDYLTQKKIPLASLESGRPIKDFDILGISIPYELTYSSILTLLDLAQIPRRSKDRLGDKFPLVVGGGSCTCNPEPLADFFDLFILGDGEEAVQDLVNLSQEIPFRQDKSAFLKAAANLPGFYVPSLTAAENCPPIKARVLKDLDQAPYPTKPVLPYQRIIHDRAVVEIMRGCPRSCHFCQATNYYAPLRFRKPEQIIELSKILLSNTGYQDLSFLSLNVAEYPYLEKLIKDAVSNFGAKKISVSLPSLRPGRLSSKIIKSINSVKKTGFTIAPEAGSEHLRFLIGKNFSEESLIADAQEAFLQGWRKLKLYFMIGLPTETEADLEAISKLCRRISQSRAQHLNISISIFIPKPHTPFQWCNLENLDAIKEKYKFLKASLNLKRFTLKYANPQMSFLEAVFCRGDRSLSVVLEKAVDLGCRLDPWSECFKPHLWREAFQLAGIDPTKFVYQSIEPDSKLPWDHLIIGKSKDLLYKIYRKALRLEETESEKKQKDPPLLISTSAKTSLSTTKNQEIEQKLPAVIPLLPAELPPFDTFETLDACGASAPKVEKKRFHYRLCFTKLGWARYLSHLEYQKAIHLGLRRAGLPLFYSEGFNPRPRISFWDALPTGVESRTEFVDLLLSEDLEINKIQKTFNACGSTAENQWLAVVPQTIVEISLVSVQKIDLKSKSFLDKIRMVIYKFILLSGVDTSDSKRFLASLENSESQVAEFLKNGGSTAGNKYLGLQIVGPRKENDEICFYLRIPVRRQIPSIFTVLRKGFQAELPQAKIDREILNYFRIIKEEVIFEQ